MDFTETDHKVLILMCDQLEVLLNSVEVIYIGHEYFDSNDLFYLREKLDFIFEKEDRNYEEDK